MAQTARVPPFRHTHARIETCQADIHVAAPKGPFSAPETLLTTVRQELLPVLSDVLSAPEWQGVDLWAPMVEIDLGDWPDEPHWADVRYVFSVKLRQALHTYLSQQSKSDRHSEARTTPGHSVFQSAVPRPRYPSDLDAASLSRSEARTSEDRSPLHAQSTTHRATDTSGSTASEEKTRSGEMRNVRAKPDAQAPAETNSRFSDDDKSLQNVQGHEGAGSEAHPAGTGEKTRFLGPGTADSDEREQSNFSLGQEKQEPGDLETGQITAPIVLEALEAFSTWLDIPKQNRDISIILAHIAGRPVLQKALVIWHDADRSTQNTAFSISETQRMTILPIAAHLKAEAERKENTTRDVVRPVNEDPKLDSLPRYATIDYAKQVLVETVANDEVALAALTQALAAGGGAAERLQMQLAQFYRALLGDGWSEDTTQLHARRLLTRVLVSLPIYKAAMGKGVGTDGTPPDHKIAPPTEVPTPNLKNQTDMSDVGGSGPGLHKQKTQRRRDPKSQVDDASVTEGSPIPFADGDDRTQETRREDSRSPHNKNTMDDDSFDASISHASHAFEDKDDQPDELVSHEKPGSEPELFRLATLLGIDALQPGLSSDGLRRELAERFARAPRSAFGWAKGQPGSLRELASLLSFPFVAKAVLFGQNRLDPRSLKDLHAADASVFKTVLTEMPLDRLTAFVDSLLPAKADLLRNRLEDLQNDLRKPEPVFQKIALALLDGTPVDFDVLLTQEKAAVLRKKSAAEHQPQPRTTTDSAQHTHNEPGISDPTSQTSDVHPGQPLDHSPEGLLSAVSNSGSQEAEELTRVLGRDLNTLETVLLFSGLTPNEVLHVTGAMNQESTGDLALPATESEATSSSGSMPARDLSSPGLGTLDPREEPSEGGSESKRKIVDAPSTSSDAPALDRQGEETRQTIDFVSEKGRSTQELLDHLGAVAQVTASSEAADLRDVLDLLQSLWSVELEQNAIRMQTHPDFAVLLAKITVQVRPGPVDLAAGLNAALPFFEPDPEKRVYALRALLARLAHLGGPDSTGLRAVTKGILAQVLSALTTPTSELGDFGQASEVQNQLASSSEGMNQPTGMKTDRSLYASDADKNQSEETFKITETAGLVLLHPYYKLLFERLKIEQSDQALRQDDVPRALGVLHFLAGSAPQNDPLIATLLGFDPAGGLPDPIAPEPDAEALMDGLLRSIIDNWGKLGATSPDGLRQTFIQRTGSLRFDHRGARLQVAPGPFDMLLDGLPWRLSPVALPWMPLPCFVSWREDEDA